MPQVLPLRDDGEDWFITSLLADGTGWDENTWFQRMHGNSVDGGLVYLQAGRDPVPRALHVEPAGTGRRGGETKM